jgi:hypothetical protein
MRIFVRVLRIFTILAVAAISVTAAHAQTDNDDNDSNSRTSCADVKPPAVNPADMIDKVPIYLIASGTLEHRARCRATEALAEGMVDVELSEDSVLAEALGDPVPDTATGEVSVFPYSEPGSRATPGQPPPGPGPESPERSHVYAAFVDPNTGVEYTFASVAENLADAEKAGVDWITSTVKPLLEHGASNARAQAPAKASALAATDATFVAADAAVGTPSYNPLAWTLLIDQTISMPNNKFAGGEIREFGEVFSRSIGGSGAHVRVYRLNGNQAENDYFLVDTAYTQTPSYSPFDFSFKLFFRAKIDTWASKKTQLTLTGKDPNHPSTIIASLYDFAPRTPVTSSTETFTVGANLVAAAAAGSGGGVSGSYSVTRQQQSVDTAVKGTIGTNNLQWTDTYNGFPVFDLFGNLQPPPSSSKDTFTGERLAIFQVPRTVNDDIPQGKHAGLNFSPQLVSDVEGVVKSDLTGGGYGIIYAGWDLNALLFVPEPQFSASPKSITVSRSKNSIDKPVIVKVEMQLPSGAQKIAWRVTTTLNNSIAVVPSVTRGEGQIDIYPTSTTDTGETSGIISVDSDPAGAADSLRNGPIQIKVKIVP